ncbi:hypothetical protein [Fictibacillus barbaricus]|uniref:Uncharacterized protein n=1 Tax=Fictibacillus barbaricus TaxID=182136 RepID=A0ABU1U2R6_9BACL|nr:hypothetical protein [Fictibacillus barbaricus]MDR7073787.1 hypothetical protein [Fictibacillus barbaricus]
MKRTNVAHRQHRGKRVSWNGNQQLSKATVYAKTAFLKEGIRGTHRVMCLSD